MFSTTSLHFPAFITIVMKFVIFSFILMVFNSQLVYGQFSAPKYSNEFLSIGVGARGIALSSTQVASVNDVTSGYWNPAGLVQIQDKYQGSLMHSEYFAGIAKYDYVGFATKVDSVSAASVTAIRFGVDDIPDTRFLFDANGAIDYGAVQFFSAADYGFLLSYARRNVLLEGLNVGGSAKIIYRSVGKFATAWGFGFDLGAQYTLGEWELGAAIKDVTGTFNAWFINSDLLEDVFAQTGNEIPYNSVEVTLPRLLFGGTRSFEIIDSVASIRALAELDVTFDGKRNALLKSNFASINPHLGLEADYKRIVFLRFGLGGIQQIKDFDGSKNWMMQPNFGIGVIIKGIQIDYALTDVFDSSDALFSNIFSLTFAINK